MLSDEGHSDIITWMPHGRAWKVLDKERLLKQVLPKYYVCSKVESFTRQLSGWGFKRLHSNGPDFGCYYHECFLRGIPQITSLIRRLPPGGGKKIPLKSEEPDFYKMSIYFPLLPDTIKPNEELPEPKSHEQATEKKSPGVSPNAMLRMPSKPSITEKFDSSVYAQKGSRDAIPRTMRTGAMPSSTGNFELSGVLRDAMPRAPAQPPNQVIREPPVVFTSPLKYSISRDYLERAKVDAIERAREDANKAFARGFVPDYNILVNSMPTEEDQVAIQMNFHSNMSHPGQGEHHAPFGLPRGIQRDTLHNDWFDGRERVVALNHDVVNGQYLALSSTTPFFNPALLEFTKYPTAQHDQNQMCTSHHEKPSSKVIHGKFTKESAVEDSTASQPFHVQMHEKLYKNSGKRMPIHGRTPAYSGERGGLDLLCLAGDLTQAIHNNGQE